MDNLSIFPDKATTPTEQDVAKNIGITYKLWLQIHDFVMKRYPKGLGDWNYPGKKYGWSYRIKDKRRAILYFLPRDQYFRVAFVFGEKATDIILQSDVSDAIKAELAQAQTYAEGRGIRVDVKDERGIHDICTLIEIKLAN